MVYDLAVALGIGFALFSFTFAYLAVGIDKKHGHLQFFFMFLCLLCFGLDIVLMAEAANIDGVTTIENILTGGGLHLFIWPFLLVVFYFIIYFIYRSFMGLFGRSDPENRWS